MTRHVLSSGEAATMVQLQLDDGDARELLEALSIYLIQFRREVAATENPEFRHRLQSKENALERILGQLEDHGG
jgi:hypothetical protein